MRTRLNEREYARPSGFSFDRKSIEKINELQKYSMLDKSQLMRIILHQLTIPQFEKMFMKERKDDKMYIKRKVLSSKKRK